MKVVEVVDPRWVLKAAALVVLCAVLCGYVTVCCLFWQAQWQFVLHPSAKILTTPAVNALDFTPVAFAPDATGKPQLTGWFLSSESTQDPTVLILHGADGNMSNALPAAHILHAARLNVFLFDYRGYGASAGPHPVQQRMEDDAASALNYLIATRGIPASRIIPFGQGLGASLAVTLATQHADFPALILDDPDGDTLARAIHDERTSFIPIRLMWNQNFPLATPIAHLTTPKLILTSSGKPAPLDARTAADPKMTVEFAHPDDSAYLAALRRFLDLYVARPAPTLSSK